MEAYIKIEFSVPASPAAVATTLRTGEPAEVKAEIQKIFFDGVEYPDVKIDLRDKRDADKTTLTAQIEIMNLAGDETIEDIQTHFEGVLDQAMTNGDIAEWHISSVSIDGVRTRVDWSSDENKAEARP